MTISVRLSEDIEKLLRDDAQSEKKNISEIVNFALEKYYNMHKYFDSIHAHHLDPVVMAEFFKLADTPEKIQSIADAGSIMTNKFIAYHGNRPESLTVHLELLEKFLKIHSIAASVTKTTDKIVFVGIHAFGPTFSEILSRGITKTLIPYSTDVETKFDEGTFTIEMPQQN